MKLLLTLVTLGLLVGCLAPRHETSRMAGSGDWGSVTNGLKCRVTIDKSEYRLSEPVRVLVEVVNSGTRSVSFGWAEIHLSAVKGSFFSTTMHEFRHETTSGQNATLPPGAHWEKTVVIRPWTRPRSSDPLTLPGTMELKALFVYRADSSSAGQSVESSVVTFEAKK